MPQNSNLLYATSIDPLLTAREAAIILQISIPTYWRRVADGTVPKPVKLGGLSRWPKSEILAVIEKAKAARAVTQ
jgi:predicted DNA-binding transcriptional regulator AlpA